MINSKLCIILFTVQILRSQSFSVAFNGRGLTLSNSRGLGRDDRTRDIATRGNLLVIEATKSDVDHHWSRRLLLQSSYLFALTSAIASFPAMTSAIVSPAPTKRKCTDIESCREIGDLKVEQKEFDNPTIRLKQGVRYKTLQVGTGNEVVQERSNLDLIFSVSTASGQYMYSRGFGFEKIDLGDGKMQKDSGLDSLRVTLGKRDVPMGIESALVGMKKGERRRVELPPIVGFETSDWKPDPNTRRGKASITSYKRILEGFGSQPAFPAETVWDIEVLRIRS